MPKKDEPKGVTVVRKLAAQDDAGPGWAQFKSWAWVKAPCGHEGALMPDDAGQVVFSCAIDGTVETLRLDGWATPK